MSNDTDTSIYCRRCGAKLERKKRLRFCPHCGHSMSVSQLRAVGRSSGTIAAVRDAATKDTQSTTPDPTGWVTVAIDYLARLTAKPAPAAEKADLLRAGARWVAEFQAWKDGRAPSDVMVRNERIQLFLSWCTDISEEIKRK